MKKKIQMAIMDDHQSIIDGYLYRLSQSPEIEVVATLAYGDELEPALKEHPADVLLLDVEVPTSSTNSIKSLSHPSHNSKVTSNIS